MIHEFQLQVEANAMCNWWNVPHVVVEGSVLEPGVRGQFIYWENPKKILVIREKTDTETLYRFYHEMRHIWQLYFQTVELYYWCTHPDEYNKVYNSQACTIEVDADSFGKLAASRTFDWRDMTDFPLTLQ
jgi:hypothetical protein